MTWATLGCGSAVESTPTRDDGTALQADTLDAGSTWNDAGADAGSPKAMDSAEASPPSLLASPVDQAGPFGVGYRTFSTTYSPVGQTSARTLKVHVWYPTTATTGEHPQYVDFFPDTVSLIDAPPSPPVEAAGYPVLVHSHGHMGFAGNSAFLMRSFASHGWVAIAPDHTGNTLLDNVEPRPPALYYLRSLDVSAALDATVTQAATWLGGATLRSDRVVLSGHSFGVHTCWASGGATFVSGPTFDSAQCATCTPAEKAVFAKGVRDPRIVALIPMAGSISRDWFGPTGHTSVTVPVLALSGGADPVGADKQFDTTQGVNLTWVELAGACHQTFGFGCDTFEAALGFRIISTYALAFARTHVLGDTSVTDILEGKVPVSAAVTLKRHL